MLVYTVSRNRSAGTVFVYVLDRYDWDSISFYVEKTFRSEYRERAVILI